MPISKDVPRSIGCCSICGKGKMETLFTITDRNGGFELARVCNKHYAKIIRSGFYIRRMSVIISLGLEMNKEGGVIRVNDADYHITRVENSHQWGDNHDANKVEAEEGESDHADREVSSQEAEGKGASDREAGGDASRDDLKARGGAEGGSEAGGGGLRRDATEEGAARLPAEVKESSLLEEFVKEDPGGRKGRRKA